MLTALAMRIPDGVNRRKENMGLSASHTLTKTNTSNFFGVHKSKICAHRKRNLNLPQNCTKKNISIDCNMNFYKHIFHHNNTGSEKTQKLGQFSTNFGGPSVEKDLTQNLSKKNTVKVLSSDYDRPNQSSTFNQTLDYLSFVK